MYKKNVLLKSNISFSIGYVTKATLLTLGKDSEQEPQKLSIVWKEIGPVLHLKPPIEADRHHCVL